MGINNFICCKRSENINGIIKHDDELSNKEEKEDYLKFAEKNNDAINNDIELNIDPELPLDFPYTQTLNNSSSKILSKNNYDDNQQELIFNENLQIKEEIIYSVNNIPNEQKIKLDKFYELCNKNGKPRSYNDFDPKGWTKFYPLNDTFFIINDTKNIEHNKIKIYNYNDLNKMKVYKGDLNFIGERHGNGIFITSYYVLIGMWKNDKFCGWGRESRCNGDTFEGRYENGLINGKGIFLNKKNCKYIGEFKNMKRWGKGKLATNKIIYMGEFYNNMIHGNGHIKFLKNNVEYNGNFKNNKIDGKGFFKFKNGEKIRVEIRNGEIIQVNDDIFENSNGGNSDFLLTKREIKNGNKIPIDNNGGNYILNNINKNALNNNENGNFQMSQTQEQNNTSDLFLSTYRNFGFNDSYT